MRLIDKYLLREFLLPLVYCFDAFLLLFIVQDLLDNLPDFIQFHAKFSHILRYYLILLPEAFVMMWPMTLLLALLFSLTNLGKHNELIAFRASGISPWRLGVPFLVVGALSAALVFVVNEAFVPRAREKANSYIAELRGKGARDVLVNFFFQNTTDRRDWYARQFDTRKKELTTVEIHQRQSDGRPLLDVFAQRAVWTNGQWRFYDADVYDYSLATEILSRVPETNFPAFREPPRQLALEGRKPDQLLTRELRRHLAALEHSRRTFRLADYRVELHYRYAFPVTCLVIIWLGLPLGMVSGRRGALAGVGMALALAVTLYFLTHITLALGRGEHLPAWVAAWLTNAVFTSVGGWLMFRHR